MLNEDARPAASAVRSRRSDGASSNKSFNRTRMSMSLIGNLDGFAVVSAPVNSSVKRCAAGDNLNLVRLRVAACAIESNES
jgi:hypothetical protein